MVLNQCREHQITISNWKLDIGHTVKLAGYIISVDRVKHNPDKVTTINDFLVPSSVHELRSFLRLANQLGQFIPDLAHVTVALSRLLKKRSGVCMA